MLQFNSKVRIVLQQYSKKYIYSLFQNVNVGIRLLPEKSDDWKEIIKKD